MHPNTLTHVFSWAYLVPLTCSRSNSSAQRKRWQQQVQCAALVSHYQGTGYTWLNPNFDRFSLESAVGQKVTCLVSGRVWRDLRCIKQNYLIYLIPWDFARGL